MSPLLLLTLSATLLMAPAEASPSSPQDEVLKMVAAVQEAGLHRDVAALDRLYAPDYFHTNPDGSIMTRDEVLATYRAPAKMTFSSSEATEQKVIVRDRLAVVNERVSLHGKTAEGDPFISSFRVTYVLERADSGWRFVNSHASLLGIDSHPK